MKFTKLAQTAALIATFLGIGKIPVNAEEKRTDFSAEEKEKLATQFGAEKATAIIEAFDKEIVALNETDSTLITINAEIASLLASQDAGTGTVEGNTPEERNLSATEQPLNANMEALTALFTKQQQTIEALMKAPEEDLQSKTTKAVRNSILNHSATHLFASNKQWDAFENRPWNARLRDASMKSTDFKEDGRIPMLENDMEQFVRENPTALNSLFNEYTDLPKQWSRRSGVLDRVSDGHIIASEIVQGRSKGWNPKNKFNISSEEGRVYAKKIDVEFDGYELQRIETSWINNYNKEGSHPYKMTFIYFLLSELVKRQMADDCNAQINGIYVQTPDGDSFAGRAVNSQNGLLYLFQQFRDVKKKYRAFDIGKPTKENIVDYVKKMIESIPEIERTATGLEIGLSSEKLQWYRERAGLLYQHLASSDSGKLEYKENHPVDYPNIIFQPLRNMTKTDFMYITESENIEIMDYNTSEKGKFTVGHEKRNTYIFADYRLGIRIKFVGLKLAEGDPREFDIQKVWSNNVPVFSEDVKAPVFDDKTGILKISYNSVKLDETFSTDITSVEGIIPGQIIKITGNKNLVAQKNLKESANLLLENDYPLNTEGTIVLLVQSDGKLKELTRSNEAVTPKTSENSFADEILDAQTGSEFYFEGVAAETLTDIINGVEGKNIKVFGSDSVALTITGNEVIKVNSEAVLSKKIHSVELVNVSGVWYETNRTIN